MGSENKPKFSGHVPNSPDSRKGQYFSFDAIMASVIFILGMSLLVGHWFAVRQTIDPTSDYLHEDVARMSDVLLSVPTPGNWNDTLQSLSVRQVGYSKQDSPAIYLNRTIVQSTEMFGLSNFNWDDSRNYNAMQTMLGVGSKFFYVIHEPDFSPGVPPLLRSHYYGKSVSLDNPSVKEYVHVRRVVALDDDTGVPRIAFLDTYLWYNQTRQ